jgi:hypothetical protein
MHKVASDGDQGKSGSSGGWPLLRCFQIIAAFLPRVITPQIKFLRQHSSFLRATVELAF